MLRTRVITAVIGIPLLLGILYAGEMYRLGFFLVLALAGLYEFTTMMKTAGKTGPVLPALLFMIALLLADVVSQPLLPLLLIALLLAVFVTVVNYPRISFDNTALIMFFSAYLGVCLSFAIQLAFLEQGFLACLVAFLLTWASDIGGYSVGRRWGKHKMAPHLSPNKSWEGALGGVGLAAITALVLSILTDMVTLTGAYALVLGVVASIAAHFGDLFMSAVKRLFQVKDSGRLLPGHGGVLDRFDSFLVVAPVVYFCLQYLG